MNPPRPLDVFFRPESIAIFGPVDTSGSIAQRVAANVRRSFAGRVLVVDGPLEERVDLAVIAAPQDGVADAISQCIVARVRAALVLSGGYLDEDILAQARAGRLRLLGPDCLGIMNPHRGLNATFAPAMAERGSVALLSQSGALCSAILDWSLQEHVGFSAFVSGGPLLDVGWDELIQYFGDDPTTKSIVLYMESLSDARSFLSASREVALRKPIIVIKAGRGASDKVFDAAFRRCGVLRVDRLADVFHMAEVLGRQPRPRGPRLSIITNAGGPGLLATDALQAPSPPAALTDLGGEAGAAAYATAVESAVNDADTDGVLVILTPHANAQPTAAAEAVAAFARSNKPVLASWMGAGAVREGIDVLNRAGIPTFAYPDTATRAFEYMWQYSSNLRSLYETPSLVPNASGAAGERIAEYRRAGHLRLTSSESRELFAAYGLPVGLVRSDGSFEATLRSFIDPQFGPVLSFGLGGRLAKVLKDEAIGLPPLNTTLARRLMEQTGLIKAIATAKVEAEIEQILVVFSRFVAEHPVIREAEINPLLFDDTRVAVLDGCIELFEYSVPDSALARPAIRPYPHQHESTLVSRTGQPFLLRPIRPEDEPLIAAFHETLSETTVYRRYFSGLSLSQRTAHDRLTRVCFIDYDREMALVAEASDHSIAGVARFICNPHQPEAEFALIVSDAHQRQGLGTELLSRLLAVARAEHAGTLTGYILPDNIEMQTLCRKLGFELHYDAEEQMMVARQD